MATLVLGAIGSAIGAGFGGTILGVSGAVIGQAVGAIIGRSIDTALLNGLSGGTRREGPRLENLEIMTSREGAALPEISGRAAIAGEVIWAAKLKEVSRTDTQRVGSGKNKQKVTTTNYDYSASLAVSLGAGPMVHLGRVWMNDKLADLTDLIADGRVRFYKGTEDQLPDPMIEAIEGSAPAYRGTSYIVFEDLPLADYGNQVPQIKCEVWGQSGEMEQLVRGVNLIPGATEWGYMPQVVTRQTRSSRVSSGGILFDVGGVFGGIGGFFDGAVIDDGPENAARYSGVSDWTVSLDQMGALLPNAETVSLIVAWFGTDLRAGLCEIEPRIENRDKITSISWAAGGLTRATANLVSADGEGRPNYGSAPADISVIEAIRDLRARGKRVVLYPFIMMDVTSAQALPNPSGAGVQGAFPWRGRITPTTGASVSQEIASFMGTATRANFSVSGESVTYTGPDEWRFRRFILHLAHLAQAAGGVDAILIGTEMRGLSMVPSAPGTYPFVQALKTLAADVRAVLPAAKISYAADWSEYHSHHDGPDLRFHMDPLWSDANIDFVGIDNYFPLSDWRNGPDHADYDNARGHTSPYAIDYLKGNIEGGEYWDWFYASEADRNAQIRAPISDGAYGEDWVYRQKAVRDWHSHDHRERIAGIRNAAKTAWVKESKPVWFTELGCPAVDLGANRPNVFAAANSSEGAFPWFSSGIRDDFMQRQFLRASLEWWRDNGGTAVDIANVQIWCWDARPWPELPRNAVTWSDAPNWYLGHWLNGRAGAAPAAEAITRRLSTHHGLTGADFDVTACFGQADGYPAAAPIGFRDYLNPLEIGLGLQAHERDGRLVVESRASAITVASTTETFMVDVDSGAAFAAKRSAIEDVVGTAVMRFYDGLGDYKEVSTRAIIGAGQEQGVASASLQLILDFDRGTAATERLLRAASDGRETITFRLPRSATQVRPGVIIPVVIGNTRARPMMVERVVDGANKMIEARSFNYGGFAATGGVFRPSASLGLRGSTSVLARFLDLPPLPGSIAEEWDSLVAFHSNPWPGSVVFAKSPDGDSGFLASGEAPLRSSIGETQDTLRRAGPALWQTDGVTVRMYSGTLVSRPEIDVLNGQNALAIQHANGWEVLQYRDAQLVGANTWHITGLLRGQLGTDAVIGPATLEAGAGVVVLNNALQPVVIAASEVGLSRFYRFGPAAIDVAAHSVRPFTGTAVGRRPYAPCHLRLKKTAGDVVFSWVRRTRIDGEADLRDGVPDVPLGEASERYALEVVVGATVARSLEVTAPTFTYTAAMATADGVSTPYTLRVAQVSQTYGPGAWSTLQIS